MDPHWPSPGCAGHEGCRYRKCRSARFLPACDGANRRQLYVPYLILMECFCCPAASPLGRSSCVKATGEVQRKPLWLTSLSGAGELTLALLVLQVLTDNAYNSATMDHLALVADLFY